MKRIDHWLRRMLPPFLADRLLHARGVPGVPDGSDRKTYRAEFTEFVGSKRGVGSSEASALVSKAEAQFKGGWGGPDFRHFTELALETFRPLYDETSDAELIRTYQFHGPVDFLRMLGYRIPSQEDVSAVVDRLANRSEVGIVDYGCGLAHRSIAIARCLMERGVRVRLTLVDIRRELHFEFLSFLCAKYGIPHEFIEVTPDHLYPELPPHDYCDNVSVMEHVREPLRVLENTHQALRSGGVFLAAVEDEIEEMMHISTNLQPVRDRLSELGYSKAAECCGVALFQKP